MKKACVFINRIEAGILEMIDKDKYQFTYLSEYQGPPVSLTMPIHQKIYTFNQFPPFFEGLLPEGIMLDALLRQSKLDKTDFFGQLLQVGGDVVGCVTIKELT
ncbi:MAG TPA: HipA N-terminal domain-containing protein [Gammaproteobacteria bacterium]|nr:HipA N-terminal domain-containing protein [Gammaproteobacteria bacterium]